ncbi:hypothetical protein D9615_003723 [Tricholomella constricta]|uniref:Uncharacterized protein n=1 Tax=Tricholomella constricta TaxID=117010 RepID=A0A8H5M7K6_9AGAR|nr:hypothetical protein D9615_003723 [Tricholomella constricta]
MTMPVLNDSHLEPKSNYGIPARTPASTALWAHLLRKDTLGPAHNSRAIIPPMTPLDKNGTSIRVLLHDTQAHLDKFSARVETLCSAVDESKREISMVKTLFQREHEALAGELDDLVNRSQTQVQSSIGTPAQAEELGRLSEVLTQHLRALDKRVDAIQLFNQTHSQTLQLQSQALQSLQDQHKTIIAVVMPLLPLLQAIPLHIDSARNAITDFMAKSFTCSPKLPLETARRPEAIARIRGSKRSSSTSRCDDSPSPLTNKRLRRTPDATLSTRSKAYNESMMTTGDLSAQPTRKRVDSIHSSKGTSGPRPAMKTPSPLTRSETTIIPSPCPMPLVTSDVMLEIQRPSCSRPISKANTSTRRTSPMIFKTGERARLDEVARGDFVSSSRGLSEGVPLSAKRPPRLLRSHSASLKGVSDARLCEDEPSTLRSGTKPQLQPTSLASIAPPCHSSTVIGPTLFAIRAHPDRLSSLTVQEMQEETPIQISRFYTPSASLRSSLASKPFQPHVTSSGAEDPSILLPGLARHVAQKSRATPSFSASRPLVPTPAVNKVVSVKDPPLPSPQLRMIQRGMSTMLPPPQRRPDRVTFSRPPVGTASVVEIAPTAKVRERRSPFRQGRRFIPLGDSDDDNDNDANLS